MNTDLFADAHHATALLADEPPLKEIDHAARVLASRELIHVTGVGKSGIAAVKLAATLSAHGVPAVTLDALNALHGDLGQVGINDSIIAISLSGNTSELRELQMALQPARQLTVGLYGSAECALAPVTTKVIPLGVNSGDDVVTRYVPSISFAVTCLVGDELAAEVAHYRAAAGPELTHPGGALGAAQPWR